MITRRHSTRWRREYARDVTNMWVLRNIQRSVEINRAFRNWNNIWLAFNNHFGYLWGDLPMMNHTTRDIVIRREICIIPYAIIDCVHILIWEWDLAWWSWETANDNKRSFHITLKDTTDITESNLVGGMSYMKPYIYLWLNVTEVGFDLTTYVIVHVRILLELFYEITWDFRCQVMTYRFDMAVNQAWIQLILNIML